MPVCVHMYSGPSGGYMRVLAPLDLEKSLKLRSTSVSGRLKSWQSLKEESEPGKSMFPRMTQRSRLALEPWENRSHFLERALLNEEKG